METPLLYQGWKTLFAGFKVSLKSQNYAESTDESMLRSALEFAAWCEARNIRDITSVKPPHLADYLTYLQERPSRAGGTLSGSSISHQLFAVRLLFDFAYTTGIIGYTVPFPKFIPPKGTVREPLTLDEVRELFAACRDPRDTAILTLCYGCGLRRNEARWLDTADVLTHTRVLYVREGKGRMHRTVPLSDRSVANLREYERRYRPLLLKRREDDALEAAYLLAETGFRLSADTIYETVRRLAAATGNPGILRKDTTTHLLRHSVATHLMERGASLKWVQAFLGHANIDTTHIYTRAGNRRVTV